MDKIIYSKLSYKVNGLIFNVYNSLGYGYQEKYYQKAIEKELNIKLAIIALITPNGVVLKRIVL